MTLLRPDAQRAFTLIEMLVVLAVLAILALIATPSIMASVIRSQVFASIPLVQFAQQSIATQYALTQIFPSNNATAALPPPQMIVSNYVSAVTVTDGVLNLTFGNQANRAITGRILSLRPAFVPGYPQVPIAWVCAKAAVPSNMTVNGTDATNLANDYLPPQCRTS